MTGGQQMDPATAAVARAIQEQIVPASTLQEADKTGAALAEGMALTLAMVEARVGRPLPMVRASLEDYLAALKHPERVTARS
jgi:hypothetical protein